MPCLTKHFGLSWKSWFLVPRLPDTYRKINQNQSCLCFQALLSLAFLFLCTSTLFAFESAGTVLVFFLLFVCYPLCLEQRGFLKCKLTISVDMDIHLPLSLHQEHSFFCLPTPWHVIHLDLAFITSLGPCFH